MIVSCRNVTPGLIKSRYRCVTPRRSARPNMSSNFEKPKTNPSFLSIRVTSASAPKASDSRDATSSPPNPAPKTRNRVDIPETILLRIRFDHNDSPKHYPEMV